MIGYARYLRRAGTTAPALLLYKVVVTLDAPAQLLTKVVQYSWRRLSGRKMKADKSLLAVRGLWHFLRSGLGDFWRA
jgi:hypothetical protein